MKCGGAQALLWAPQHPYTMLLYIAWKMVHNISTLKSCGWKNQTHKSCYDNCHHTMCISTALRRYIQLFVLKRNRIDKEIRGTFSLQWSKSDLEQIENYKKRFENVFLWVKYTNAYIMNLNLLCLNVSISTLKSLFMVYGLWNLFNIVNPLLVHNLKFDCSSLNEK